MANDTLLKRRSKLWRTANIVKRFFSNPMNILILACTVVLGYLVGPYPSKVDYLPQFKEAALALTEVGQCSGIVETESGFHILRLESKLPGGIRPLSQVHDAIHAMLLKADQTEQLTALLKAWVS